MKSLLLSRCRNRGFTLIELLVVMGIVLLLGSLAFPMIRGTVARGKTVKSVSNLRQIHMGVVLWAGDRDGDYPVNYWPSTPDAPADTDRVWYQSVGMMLYPDKYALQKKLQIPWLQDSRVFPRGWEGTILRSPNVEPGNPITVASYGLNTTFNRNNSPYKYPTRYNTAITVLAGDNSGKTHELAPGSTVNKNLNARNGASRPFGRDGSAAVVFLDGHTEMLTQTRCAELNADNTDPFWGQLR